MSGPALRLDRLLANLGYGSRTEVNLFIKAGNVTVDGTVVRDPSMKTKAASVRLDGEPMDHPEGVLVMLHKPVDVVCSHEPDEGTRAYDLVPEHWEYRNPRVESIGRLDKDTSGLLLLTDDHQLVHRLTSPKRHVTKRYEATLDAPFDDAMATIFASGTLHLDGDKAACHPATVVPISSDGLRVAVTLTEGRYHQVRRMVAACGNHVHTLHRTHFGDYTLGALPLGEWIDVPLP
jgi:16S rRNA pseudouridine516 synthase